MIPECSKWQIWIGKEIEGTTALGEETLFIRVLDISASDAKKNPNLRDMLTKKGRIKRVWFCAEYHNWPLLREITKFFTTTCLEVTPASLGCIPKDVVDTCIVYFKLNVRLKVGDHICVGPPYQDEAFQIGQGQKVTPEQYAQDIKIV